MAVWIARFSRRNRSNEYMMVLLFDDCDVQYAKSDEVLQEEKSLRKGTFQTTGIKYSFLYVFAMTEMDRMTYKSINILGLSSLSVLISTQL